MKNTDFFTALDEIYLVFISKKVNILYITFRTLHSGKHLMRNENHKATNVGSSLAHQQPFPLRADGGPLIVVFGYFFFNFVRVGPTLTKLSGSAHAYIN